MLPLPGESLHSDNTARTRIDLSGTWQYSLDGDSWEPVRVPSAYDFVGKVTFARAFEIGEELLDKSNFKLVADGINYECEVSINDVFVGKHVGGYTSFALQIPENALQVGKNNVIKIVVNNHLNASTTIPVRQQVWGWRNYGGIYRDLYILATPRVWIDDLQVQSSLSSDLKTATIRVVGVIDNSLAESERKNPGEVSRILAGQYRLSVELFEKGSQTPVTKPSVIDFGVTKRKVTRVEAELKLPNPKLWQPDNRELYLLKATILKDGAVLDGLGLELGVRTIALKGSDIYLNGNKLFLQGILWREDHPRYGSAMTDEALEEDIQLIKNLGANLVRVANHPPHPYFLTLCDRYGLLVMEEIPVWNVPAAILSRDYYQELSRSYAKEMVTRDRNHASVFAWGIGDDFDSSEPAAKEFVREIRTVIESLDDRPIYYATSMLNNDVASEEVDFAALNISSGDPKQFRHKLDEWKQKHPSQPTIVARYGKPVEPENYNGYSDPMSIEAQSRYLMQHYEVIKDAKIAGGVIAALADWRGDRPIMTIHNNTDRFLSTMGLVSYHREKRPSYEKVRALYNNEKIPALSMGTYSEKAPITFVSVGFFLLLGFAYILKSHRRFRENVVRSFLRPYNFFADIRDQRILSYFQTSVLGLTVAITMGLVIASTFYYARNSDGLDYVLTHFLSSDSMKAAFGGLIWYPFKAVVYFSIIFVGLLIVVTLLVKVFSFFVQSRVFFFHAYSVTVWSALPIVLLIPVGMVLYRVMESEPYVVPLLCLTGAVVLWGIARLLKGVSIIYDVAPIRVYATGLAAFVIFLSGLLAYYNYTHSTLAYYKFFVNFVHGSS